MTKINNEVIAGIEFKDCEFVDKSKQPPCPLESTALSHLCMNEYRDLRYRKEEPCAHAADCSAIIKEFNSTKS